MIDGEKHHRGTTDWCATHDERTLPVEVLEPLIPPG